MRFKGEFMFRDKSEESELHKGIAEVLQRRQISGAIKVLFKEIFLKKVPATQIQAKKAIIVNSQ